MSSLEDLKRLLGKDSRPKKRKKKSSMLLGSGSTLLNLACSDSAFGAFLKGHYYFLVGDSASGKTWLSFSAFAEASINPAFSDYRFIYDGVEYGALMDCSKYFGSQVEERLEAPGGIDEAGLPINSTIVESFYFHIDQAFDDGKPFIYVLDSMDSLDTADDSDKFEEEKQAFEKGKEVAGTFGVSKAKANSRNLRRVINRLKETGSILIIISQTRDNIGFGKMGKTRAGGRALTFYATLEIWTSIKGKLNKKVRSVDREVGVLCKAQIKKNRVTGKDRRIEFPIYHSFGIDDIGSCVDYLLEEKHWNKIKQTIDAKEFGIMATREKLISHVEEEGLERKLRLIVQKVWREIEEACAIQRKQRY